MTTLFSEHPTPCTECDLKPSCAAYLPLDQLIYSGDSFRRSTSARLMRFLPWPHQAHSYALIRDIIQSWRRTFSASPLLVAEDPSLGLAALFDLLMSALYASLLFPAAGTNSSGRQVIAHHHTSGETWQYFPYLWICPGCISDGVPATDAYLPGSSLRNGKRYPQPGFLARPAGRMIGDLGALVIYMIMEEIAGKGAHFSTGGGHRGEFDIVISTESRLILGEIKASPLVAYPIAARLAPGQEVPLHTWNALHNSDQWAMFLGAQPEGSKRHLLLSRPSNPGVWPFEDVRKFAQDRETVEDLFATWRLHFDGYREFNNEDARTRWHRFGCGNIETRESGTRVQLRIDNTKTLPGIDRTDDIKKGLAQVLLFARLKRGCGANRVKTALFGNLYAETHHEHYVKPLASARLLWSDDSEPQWLFDAIIALSRNIINDSAMETMFPLLNSPYSSEDLQASDLEAMLEPDDDDDGNAT